MKPARALEKEISWNVSKDLSTEIYLRTNLIKSQRFSVGSIKGSKDTMVNLCHPGSNAH